MTMKTTRPDPTLVKKRSFPPMPMLPMLPLPIHLVPILTPPVRTQPTAQPRSTIHEVLPVPTTALDTHPNSAKAFMPRQPRRSVLL